MLFSVYGQEMEPPRETAARTEKMEPVAEAGDMEDTTAAVAKENTGEAAEETDVLELLIEDEGFRECVCSDIFGAGIHDGDSREEILKKLEACESLRLEEDEEGNRRICSLEALSLMPNLKQLIIDIDEGTSRIGDLTPIARLTKLERLSIYYRMDEPIDLSFLGGMSHITELGLYGCGVSDISFVSGLTSLRALYLDGNAITDLSPLAGLDGLEEFSARRNRISDISVLEGMPELFGLYLGDNEISDISALTRLTHLNRVELYGNQITDLSPLADKEELMYVVVFENPLKSLRPVFEVPQLVFSYQGVSEEEEDFITDWLAVHYPEAVEFTCVDFLRGDLNNDGREDIAFVADSDAFDEYEGEEFAERMPEDRRLFVLLQGKDGSWKELEETPPLYGSQSGGLRGGPYDRAFMEAGYLVIVQGWGSSAGTTERQIYEYRNGDFYLQKRIRLDDDHHMTGYDVEVQDEETGFWQRYVLAWDGEREVRVDVADTDHPRHRAYPDVSIYAGSHYIDGARMRIWPQPQMSAAEALELAYKAAAEEGDLKVREKLPYAGWQKENYDRLLGVPLPDYYYVLSEPEKETEDTEWTGDSYIVSSVDGNREWIWAGDYLNYGGMKMKDERLYHVVELNREGEHGADVTRILIDDATGEIIEE